MMPYRMLNTIIRICAQTFPFAAKISEVMPTQTATSVRTSTLPDTRLERMTINSDPSQRSHSFLVRSCIGLCIRDLLYGNTAQRLCDRCVVKFFVR